MMRIRDEIEHKLRAQFAPSLLRVEDDSDSHRGHGGWREGGETHFNVTMRAASLAPLSRLGRHRAVHSALGADLVARIHALALDLDG
jgi:BolA protein